MRVPVIASLVLVLKLLPAPAFSHDVVLAWDANTESDLAGYRVYFGSKSRDYTTVLDAGAATTRTLRALADGEYYFAVTAYNTSGLESGYSNEAYAALGVLPTRLNAVTMAGAPEVRVAATVATVSWAADRQFTGSIEWGQTPELGHVAESSGTMATSRLGALPGLAPGGTCYYRIRMIDGEGNLVVTPLESFKTNENFIEVFRESYTFPLPVDPPPQESGGMVHGAFAVVNPGAAESLIEFTAYDSSGTPVRGAGITNPTYRILRGGEQEAEIDAELFGAGMVSRAGWIRLASTGSETTAMFLQFAGDLSEGTAESPVESPAREWIVPGIEPAAQNVVTVVNTGDEQANLRISLVDGAGETLETATRTIRPRGALRADVLRELFPAARHESGEYLRTTSDSPLAVSGFVRGPGGKGRIAPGYPVERGAASLVAPQWLQGGGWSSSLHLVNLDPNPGTVELYFLPEGGNSVRPPIRFEIAARGKLELSEPGLFADSPKAHLRGSLILSSSGIRLGGSMSLGDADGRKFSTELPLVGSLSTDLLVPHVASDGSFFSGLALSNPFDVDAEVTVELHSGDGATTAAWSGPLPARQLFSKLLEEWFPGLPRSGPTAGYVRIHSSSGVAAFAVIGTHDLSMLFTQPARPIP